MGANHILIPLGARWRLTHIRTRRRCCERTPNGTVDTPGLAAGACARGRRQDIRGTSKTSEPICSSERRCQPNLEVPGRVDSDPVVCRQ